MKEIVLSVQPQWCEKIANGEKTVEIRKRKPSCEVPFKVYIYCTKPSKKHQTIRGSMVLSSDELFKDSKGNIKHGNSIELMGCENYTEHNFMNGKVIGEFICRKIHWFGWAYGGIKEDLEDFLKGSCMSNKEAREYSRNVGNMNIHQELYAWQISDLMIYEKPELLSNFGISRAPQSYCYLEGNDEYFS